MNKTVLCTGAAGGVGVHVIAHIMHKTDFDVVILDSFRHKGYRDRITEATRDHPDWLARIRTYQHDLACPISPELKAQIGPVNYILHLAAMSDVFFSVENPAYVIKNNIESTLTMLEYAKHTEHEAFVYFSTDEVYGPVKKNEAHREWSPHRPSNAYSASKAASEDIAYCYWRAGWVKLIVTNTMNNFGEMQSASKFPVIVQKAVESGDKVQIHGNDQEIGTRFYIHSRNVADALLYILSFPPTLHAQGELDEPDRYHIVGDERLSNLELAQCIARLMKRNLNFELVDFHKDNPAHDIHYGLQDNKLRPHWRQPLDFETSLKNTISWQQEHPGWID